MGTALSPGFRVKKHVINEKDDVTKNLFQTLRQESFVLFGAFQQLRLNSRFFFCRVSNAKNFWFPSSSPGIALGVMTGPVVGGLISNQGFTAACRVLAFFFFFECRPFSFFLFGLQKNPNYGTFVWISKFFLNLDSKSCVFFAHLFVPPKAEKDKNGNLRCVVQLCQQHV